LASEGVSVGAGAGELGGKAKHLFEQGLATVSVGALYESERDDADILRELSTRLRVHSTKRPRLILTLVSSLRQLPLSKPVSTRSMIS
jgi:hypothetical protein